MNSRDIVVSTMQGKRAERFAFTAVMSLYGAKLTGNDLEKHYNDPDAYADGQSAVRETFGVDILCSPFMLPGQGEAFGGKIKYFKDSPPNLLEPAIDSISQIKDIQVPDVDSNPRLLYFREALKKIVAEHGKDVPVCGITLGPIDLPLMIMGIDEWLNTFLFDDDGLKRTLDITVPHFIEWANTLFADGADFLVLPSPFLSPSIITAEIAREKIVSVLKDAFSKLNGPAIIHHTGAAFTGHLELYRDIPNAAGFVVDHADDLYVAREKIGEDKLLICGPDGPNICNCTPEEIEKFCKEKLENRRDDNKFILMTTGADIAFNTPQENINAISTTVKNFHRT